MHLTPSPARPRGGRALPKAFLLAALLVCLAAAAPHVSPAQPGTQNTRLQEGTPTPTPLDEVIERALDKKLKERDVDIKERVRTEINNTFGWNVSLLGLLTGVLAALPIFVGIAFLFLRSSIQRQMLNQIESEAGDRVAKKFDSEVNAKVTNAMTGFEDKLRASESQLKGMVAELEAGTQRISLELARKGEQIFTQRTLKVLIRLVQRSFKTQMAQRSNQSIIDEMRREIDLTRSTDTEKLTFIDHLNLGMFSHIVGKYDEAVGDYDRAIKAAGDDLQSAEALMMKGDALYRLGDYEAALTAYSESVSKNGQNFEALTYRGNTLYRLERFDEALKSFDDAIAINPHFPDAPFYKARCYTRMGQAGPAIEALRKAIELNPGCWEEANVEGDFDPIKSTPEFKELGRFDAPAV